MSAADGKSELSRHASLIMTLLLGTAITFWNVRDAAYYSQRGHALDQFKRRDSSFFALGIHKSVIRQMARDIALPYHDGPVSSHEDKNEHKAAANQLVARAHLGHQYFLASPPGTKNLTRWTVDSRLRSYIEGGVAYDAGCLVAKESGYYYVYSQVSFVKALRDWTVNQSAVTHELIRLSNTSNNAETLLRSQQTHSWDKQVRCSLDASYLGATFFLQKGDRIFVAVSDANFIWQSPRRTYFGMYSL